MASPRLWILPLAGLALIVLAAFADVAFLGKTIQTTEYASGTLPLGSFGYEGPRVAESPVADPGCSAWQTDVADRLIHRIYATGGLPLWAEDEMLGSPLAANMCCAAFSPTRIPRFLSPGPLVGDVWALTRLVVAGLGAFVFARRRLRIPLAALTTAVAFMLSGYFVSYVNIWHLDCEMQLPWLAVAFDRLVERPGRGTFAVAMLLVTLSIVVGQPESTFFEFALVALLMAHRILGERERAGHARRFFAAMVFGHLLAAFLLVPFVESLRECTAPAHSLAAGLHAASWKTALTLVAPRAFGGHYGKWNGVGPFDVATHVGAVTLFLALLGAKGSGFGRFLGVVTLVTVLKVFGTPGLNDAIGRLPAFSVSDFVKYVMPELALVTALLAGMGIDCFVEGSVSREGVLGAAFAIGVPTGVLAAVNREGLVAHQCLGHPLLALGYLALAAGIAILATRRRAFLLAALVGVELVLHVPRERAARHEPFSPPPWVESLASWPRPLRVLTLGHFLHPNTGVVFGIDGVRAVEAMFPNRYYAVMKALIPHIIDDRLPVGSESAYLYRSRATLDLLGIQAFVTAEDLLDPDRTREIAALATTRGQCELVVAGRDAPAFVEGPDAEATFELDVPRTDPVLRFTAVSKDKGEAVLEVQRQGGFERVSGTSLDFGELAGKKAVLRLSAKGGTVAWSRVTLARPWTSLTLVHDGPDARVYRNSSALPRAWVVHRSVVVPTEEIALQAIASSLFDPRSVVVLEGSEPPLQGVTPPSVASLVLREPRRVRLECDTPEPGFLILGENYYPGWKATIDGNLAPIVPADVLFRGVRLERGHHTVEFFYSPPSFWIGVGVSAATALALLLFALIGVRIPRETVGAGE